MKTKMMIAIVVVLALLLGIGGMAAFGSRSESLAAGGVLRLSVNPEVAIYFDENGNVTNVEARNEDGTAILEGYVDFAGKTAGQVVTDLVSAIGEAGYFVEEVEGEGRRITLELEPGSKVPSDNFLQELLRQVQECVNENNWTAPVDVKVDFDEDKGSCTNPYCDDKNCDDGADCDDGICTNPYCDDDDCDDTDCDEDAEDDDD